MTLSDLTPLNLEIMSDGTAYYVCVLPDGEPIELREFIGRLLANSKLVQKTAEMRQMQAFFYAEKEKGVFVKSALNQSKRLEKEVDALIEKTFTLYLTQKQNA